MADVCLTQIELRVLGTLCEKQKTVPDTYPLSLNALLAGCNQKTSRNPTMELTEADVSTAIDGLRDRGLAVGDHEEADAAHLALADRRGAGPEVALLEVARETSQLSLAQSAEERDLLQIVGEARHRLILNRQLSSL